MPSGPGKVLTLDRLEAGWGKIQNPMGWMGPDSVFPGFLLLLAVVAGFGGGIALLLGLVPQLAALKIFCTMIGAIYLHKIVMGDPFMVIGAGRYSLDRRLFGIRN